MTSSRTMNLLDAYKVTIHTALPDTQRSHNNDGWLGVVHVHYAQAGREHRRNIHVTHGDDGTTDEYGATGPIKVFGHSATALNAALQLSKRVLSGDVHVSQGRVA